jgi:hypothetical protein
MRPNRRAFICSPLFALGLFEEMPDLGAYAQSTSASDVAALDFWTRGMGLSAGAIPASGPITRGGKANAGPGGGFAREPIFLHYSEAEKTLLTTDQIDRKTLLDSGDAQVDFQLQRLRLNGQDNAHFARYTSGGIYLDMTQGQSAAAPAASASPSPLLGGFSQFASSVFSAFFPTAGGKGGSSSGGASKSGGGAAAKKGSGFFAGAGPTASSGASGTGAPIALQNAKQSQSLPLPSGSGKASFSAFVKDPKKTAFGHFVDALTSLTANTSPYAQLLTIPFIASPGLAAIHTIVANLQLQGGNQEVVMQGPQMDLAATAAAFANVENPLPLRSGSYIAIPREHGPLIKPELNKLKIMNGFLVPKDATDLDVTPDLVGAQVPGLTYLSLGVSVKNTRATAAPSSKQG